MGIFDLFKGDRTPLVSQALQDISVMINTGERMIAAATGHLLDNEVLDEDLEELDAMINSREVDLRRVLLEHLSVNPKQDLVFSLKLLSIVHEAERIGDLAKSLAETAALASEPRTGKVVDPLRHARDAIVGMLGRVRGSLATGDDREAVLLMTEHADVKERLSLFVSNLAVSDGVGPNQAIVLALAARMLSRVSSHIANIASTVASPFDKIRGTTISPLIEERLKG
ncbi:MAG: hypothetical protein HKN37_11480 [Rhodothermales bacterium]|nr:hypothetical protein [Rhodothermales bacterium]